MAIRRGINKYTNLNSGAEISQGTGNTVLYTPYAGELVVDLDDYSLWVGAYGADGNSANQVTNNLIPGGIPLVGSPAFSPPAQGPVNSVQYNFNGNLTGSSTFTFSNGQLVVPSIGVNYLNVANNFTLTGTLTTGNIAAGGNVSANYFLGNGAFLTGLYSNANVANYLTSLTSNVQTTANVNASYFNGNGAFLTGLNFTNYSNANVANYLQVLTSNITTTANISGSYLIGNIRSATGGYNDSNVAAYLPSYTGALQGSSLTVQGNISSLNGNVSASYFLGNGSFLTGLPSTYSNANVANYLPVYVGNIGTFGNNTFRGNFIIGNILPANNFIDLGSNTAPFRKIYAQQNVEVGGSGTSFTISSDSGVASFQNVQTGAAASIEAGDLTGADGFLDTLTVNTISATGNITTSANIQSAYLLGNGAFITGLPAGYSNANVANYLPTYTGALNPTNLTVAGISALGAPANVHITGGTLNYYLTSDGAGGLAWASGTSNITGNGTVAGADQQIQFNNGTANFAASANLKFDYTQNLLLVNGNTQANYFLGNGAFLTGLPATYSNADVANYLPTYTGNLASLTGNVTTTANISAAYVLGNGAFLTGLPATYSNANVANFLLTNTGNVSANYFLGNGALLTGLDFTNYSNANVANYLPTYTGNIAAGNATISNTIRANIVAGNFIYSDNYSYANGAPLNFDNTIVIDNYPGSYQDTGYTVGSVDGTPPQTIRINSGNVVSSFAVQDRLSFNSATPGNTIYFIEALSFDGSQTVLDLNTAAGIAQFDTIYRQPGNTTVVNSLQAGQGIVIGTTSNIGNIGLANSFSVPGNITANYFVGNGYYLTGLNIPAGYSNANVANYLSVYNGNILASNATFSNNVVILGNLQVIGNTTFVNTDQLQVSNLTITLAANANTASQANGAGILIAGANISWLYNYVSNTMALNIDQQFPNVVATGNVTGNYILGNGYYLTGLPTQYSNANVANYLPVYNGNILGNTVTANLFIGNFQGNISGNLVVPGANTQVLFNNNGNAGADGGFTYDRATGNVGVGGNINSGNITTGNITANYFLGNGAFLTGLPAQYSNANVANYLPTYTGNLALSSDIIALYANAVAQSNAITSINSNVAGANNNIALANAAIANLQAAQYSNANVANYLPTYTGNLASLTGNVTTTANVSAGYFLGNGAFLTGLPTQYSNANVANYLPTYTGNIAGNLTTNNVEYEYHVSPTGRDGGPGTQQNPYRTIQFAVNQAAGNGEKVVVHPGTYAENVTVNVQSNFSLVAAQSDVGSVPFINGNLDVTGNTTSIRIQGVSAANLNLSTTGTVYPTQMRVQQNITKSGTGYVEAQDADWQVTGQINITGSGTVLFVGGKIANAAVANNSATLYLKDSITAINTTGTAGIISTEGTLLYANSASGNAITASNCVVLIRSSSVLDTGLDPTKIGLTDCYYSISDVIYDQPSTDFSSATSLNSVTDFQTVRTDSLIVVGNITGTGASPSPTLSGFSSIGSLTANIINNLKVGLANVYSNGVVVTSGNVTTTANVSANYYFGNIRFATGGYSNSNVQNYLPTYSGNVGAGNVIASSTIYANLFVGNFQGNITGNLVVPGSNTQVLFNSDGNAGADSGFTYDRTTQNVIVAGNVTANYFLGNIRSASGGYSNSNVASYLPVYGGNILLGNANIANGNLSITTANLPFSFVVAPVANGAANTAIAYGWNWTIDVEGGVYYPIEKIIGLISNQGPMTGTVIDLVYDQFTTGLDVTFTTPYPDIITAADYGYGNALLLANNVGVTFSDNTFQTTAFLGYDSATFYGNVTANYLLGNGAFLTGISAGSSYSNANVANYLPVYGGNISANTITGPTTGNGRLNLTATNGNSIIANASGGGAIGLYSGNSQIFVNNDTPGAGIIAPTIALTPINGGDIIFDLNVGNSDFFIDTASGSWQFNNDGNLYGIGANANISGNVIANYFLGNGSQLTGLNFTNYSNANVANYLPTYTGNVGAGNIVFGDGYSYNGNGFVSPQSIGGALKSFDWKFSDNTTGNDTVTLQWNLLDTTANQWYLTTDTQANIWTLDSATRQLSFSATGVTPGAALTFGNSASNGTGSTNDIELTSTNSNVYVRANNRSWQFSNTGNLNAPGNIIANPTIGTLVLGAATATGSPGLSSTTSLTITANRTGTATSWVFGNDATLTAPGNISTSGNITANYYIGNGSQLTGIQGNYSNANVANYLPIYSGNLDSVGNITVSNNVIITGNLRVDGNTTFINANTLVIGDKDIIVANGAVQASDANGAGILVGSTGQFASMIWRYAGNLWDFSGNIAGDAGYFDTLEVVANITNLGNTNVTGNVTAGYYYGNGYYLTGIQYSNLVGAYSNSNVAAYLPTYTGNLVSLTGNVTTTANVQGAYLLGNGAFITGLPAQYSNANVANYLPTYTGNLASLTGNVITTANVQANYYFGNAAFMTGLPNVTNTPPVNFAVTSNGVNQTFTNVYLGYYTSNTSLTLFLNGVYLPSNNYTLSGSNLTVTANLIAGDTLDVPTSFGNTQTANLTATASGSNTQIQYNYNGAFAASSQLTFNQATNTLATGNVQANYFLGNGAFLTGLPAQYSNANVANYLPTYTGNLNLVHDVIANSVTANLFVGTFQGNISGNFVVPGANKEVIFNNQGNAAASDNFLFDDEINLLTVDGTIETTGNITALGNISADYVLGNGRFLTGLLTNSYPSVNFTVAANGNSQTFSNSVLSIYESNAYMSVYHNGVWVETRDYSISGNILTINQYLNSGDDISVGPTGPATSSPVNEGSPSDRRLKDNIVPTTINAVQILNSVPVVDFTWKADSSLADGNIIHTGFIAQEVEVLIPDAVKDINNTKILNKQELVPTLWKALQETMSRVTQLEDEVRRLKGE